MIWALRVLVPTALALPLILVLRAGTDAVIAPKALLVLGLGLWALCLPAAALGLVGGRLSMRLPGWLLLLAGGLAWGPIFAFHLRESTAFPPHLAGLVAVALAASLAATLLLRLLCGAPGRRSTDRDHPTGWGFVPVSVVLALAAPAVVFLVGGIPGLGGIRWHALHHARILGSPAQALLGTPPAEREAATLASHALDGEGALLEVAARFAPPATPFTAAEEAPSIVFVLLDTLRADAFTRWGGDDELMPRLAETFEQCVRFTDVLANSSWTRPSIASFHTGLLPEHHGARGVWDPLDDGHRTFVEVLQTAGWETVGLVTNPTAGPGTGLDQGFDDFLLLERDPYARAEVLNRSALQVLERRAEAGSDAPLFLYLHYLDPHEPYLAGAEPNGWSASSYRRAYADELSYLDGQLDAVLPEIREALGPDTLFFFVSDHGEEFFEHELFGHGHTLYDEVVRIPMALCGRPFAGSDVEARLEGRDVFSLMLGLANGAVRSNLDLARWADDHHRRQRNLYLSFRGFGRLQLRPYLQSVFQRALDTPEGVWIWNAYGDTWEFHDAADPAQQDNRAAAVDGTAPRPPRDLMESAAPRPWFRTTPMDPDDESRARLGRLGYVQ